MSHWTEAQQARLRECVAQGDAIAYWTSDAHGRPTNGGTCDGWAAYPGMVQTLPLPTGLCGPGALHATMQPHRWAGCRVWVVALRGDVLRVADKFRACEREILGEVFPEEAMDESVGVRLGRKDLRGAYLRGANLSRASLSRANLYGADLRGANLTGADLPGADLAGADLAGANLSYADLSRADLSRADLSRADLSRAHLRGADLRGADLSGADLSYANLSGARRYSSDAEVPGWPLENGVLLSGP